MNIDVKDIEMIDCVYAYFTYLFNMQVENNVKDIEIVIKRIGPVMYTTFGGVWTFTNDLARADTAYTTVSLGPHNDNTYYEDAAGLD